MTSLAAKTMRLAALAAGLLVFGQDVRAQVPAAERLAAYEVTIANGDPAGAIAFLKDGEARKLAEVDSRKGAALLGKASALKDLKDLLAMPLDDSKSNQLSQALAIRIDRGSPLTKMGIGPEPEKLLAWLDKYQPKYPEAKKPVVKKAIRQWEVVFGTTTQKYSLKWDQAGGVSVNKADWETQSIYERNITIAKLAASNNGMFWGYNDQRVPEMKEKMVVEAAVDAVIKSGQLSQVQLDNLDGKTYEQQMVLLGGYFDNSELSVSPELKARVNSARDSLKSERLSPERRDLLGDMLNDAVSKELAGTKAGDKVLAFYGGQLKIIVEPCRDSYSGYDPATGAIKLDSKTIEQYMRMKGLNADSIIQEKELVALAKYMSPSVVYEAGHVMQAAWAKKQGVYAPRVQEDEIEAMSLEGLYTAEKVRRDPDFLRILTSSREFSSYAAKKLEVGTEYKTGGQKKFATTVRQRYFSRLPSLDAAASQVLDAVTGELDRRETLPADQKTAYESADIDLEDALSMKPGDLASEVERVQTPALVKIQGDLSSLGVYNSRYSASDREDRKGRKALKSLKVNDESKTSTASRSKVPLPI